VSTTLITLAADYVSGLLVQGETPAKALDHARLRFGIAPDLIQAEIDARHAFSLAVSHPFSNGLIEEVPAAAPSGPWCTCGAKTPQGQYHDITCPARKAAL
jgi:hypothetical protein